MPLNIEQWPTARDLPARKDPPRCFIIHGTGATSARKILAYYQSADGLCPHYVINTDGTIYQTADEGLIAYHAATPENERALYRMGWQNWSRFVWNSKTNTAEHIGGEFTGYRGWRETWFDRGYQSPLDLIPGGYTNARTIGIELVSLPKPTPRVFCPVQYQALAELLNERGKANGIPINRETVLGHSDVNPLRRCNERGSWDPGPVDYNHLWDLVTAR